MLEQRGTTQLDSVIRALASAGKALRLYPPTSPLPRQSVVSAEEARAAYFGDGETVLSLAHLLEPNPTQTAEAVSIAQHHLAQIGELMK